MTAWMTWTIANTTGGIVIGPDQQALGNFDDICGLCYFIHSGSQSVHLDPHSVRIFDCRMECRLCGGELSPSSSRKVLLSRRYLGMFYLVEFLFILHFTSYSH